MITIQLKAKHYYYIAYYLRNKSIEQYYKLTNRIKTQLQNNLDMDAMFDIDVHPWEIIDIFSILTNLPEGQATMINAEMMDLLQPQMVTGITSEMMNGILPDLDGNLPENALWQTVAAGITARRNENFTARDAAITYGQQLIDQL